MNGVYPILEYGAQSGADFDATASIQSAIDACHAAGGGRVLVTPGLFRILRLTLRAHVELHLMAGARLVGISDPRPAERLALLEAKDADFISVTGLGVIDGDSQSYVATRIPYHLGGVENRPKIMLFEHCKNVTITGITIENAPTWTIHPVGCENVLISSIRILNDLRMANSDGIDPDHCQNVRIADCTIRCADDCIVLKNTLPYRQYGPCRDILITGCQLTSTSAGFKIGSETWDRFENIVMSDCIITDSNRGIGIQLRDTGSVETALFQNITIHTRYFYPRFWGKADPIWITAIPRDPDQPTGSIRGVRFSNIVIRSEGSIFVQGTQPGDISGVTFDGLDITLYKQSKWEGGLYDRRPATMTREQKERAPRPGNGREGNSNIPLLDISEADAHRSANIFRDKANALRLENASDVCVRNTTARFEGDQPYYGDALRAIDVNGLRVENFRARTAHADDRPLRLENTTMA